MEEVEDVSDFVKKLDKLEMPNQLVAVLEDPLLRKLISLKPSGANRHRLQRDIDWRFD